MEPKTALTEIARLVEGALERLDQQRPRPRVSKVVPLQTSCSARRPSPHNLRERDGDTTETDSEPEEQVGVKYEPETEKPSPPRGGSGSPSPSVQAAMAARPKSARTQTLSRTASAETVEPSTPVTPVPTASKAYRRPPARLLTSRVAAAIIARAEPTECDCCGESFEPARRPSQDGASLQRIKCACCKRPLRAAGISEGQERVKKTEMRCCDCEKAGKKGLERVRRAAAEKKRLANEKRKATLANKKRQLQGEENEGDQNTEDENVGAEIKAARQLREKRMQKNFAAFSTLILQSRGGGEGEDEDDTTERGLKRLRQDRARRGQTLVGVKRRQGEDDSSSQSSGAESEREPPPRKQSQAKRRRSDAVPKKSVTPLSKKKPSRAKEPKEKAATTASSRGARTSTSGKQRTPPALEVIEIDDSD